MKQQYRSWIGAAGACALLGGAAGAFAWTAPGLLPVAPPAWDAWLPQVPAGQRAWLLLPAGVLAMLFTARRTRARGSSF